MLKENFSQNRNKKKLLKENDIENSDISEEDIRYSGKKVLRKDIDHESSMVDE